MNQLDLLRGCTQIIPSSADLFDRNGPLTIKCGFDPTSPDLHLGHMVLLKKLKDFQDFGHKIVIIFGTFTARIGDPTDKNKTRPQLTIDEIKSNTAQFAEQIYKVLDPNIVIAHNSDWFDSMTADEMIKLASSTTVSQMLNRNDFKNRFENEIPISLHEFLYPLLQGYDSCVVKADLELGGTDQLFNLHMGRALQEMEGNRPQMIMTMPILLGTDGVQKMSKSLKNTINFNDTPFHIRKKILNMPDSNLESYFQLLTNIPMPADALEAKQVLSEFLIGTLCKTPDTVLEIATIKDLPVSSIINSLKLVKNSAAAREIILLGKVLVDDVVATLDTRIFPDQTVKIKVGKNEPVMIRLLNANKVDINC